MEPISSKDRQASNAARPAAAEVVAAYAERKALRSPVVKQAQQYARQELASGKKIEPVRDELMRAGYPQTIAETVMWTGYLAAKRGRAIDHGIGAFGVALALIVSSLWIGVKFGIPVNLGGAASVCLIVYGFVRLAAAFRIPNWSGSFRRATGIGSGR